MIRVKIRQCSVVSQPTSPNQSIQQGGKTGSQLDVKRKARHIEVIRGQANTRWGLNLSKHIKIFFCNGNKNTPSLSYLPLTCYSKSTHTLTCNPLHGTLTQLCKTNAIARSPPQNRICSAAEGTFHKPRHFPSSTTEQKTSNRRF